ncbi:MAG: lysoplasmalogenase family protein [Salibacteraceae bacterium]
MSLFYKRLLGHGLLYFSLVFIIFYFHFTEYRWNEYITKPLTLLILLRFFFLTGGNLHPGLRKGVVLGLIFSILSDFAFLLRLDISTWFIIGTFSFSLLTMYAYSSGFQFSNKKYLSITDFRSITPINLFLSVLMIAFPISIFIIEDLELWQYPAILFQLLMWFLISQGLKRQDHVNELSYYLVLSGIVLYSITTMLLTLQNFTQGIFNFKGIPVFTYFTAQFFMVIGTIYQNPKEEPNQTTDITI